MSDSMYIEAEELASRIGVKPKQVHRLARAGRLPAVVDGKKLRFPRLAVEQFFRDQNSAALASVQGASVQGRAESNGTSIARG